ncbi:MAG: glycerate kinase [Bacteroidota bacterium]
MKIVIAPDSFKDCMGALAVAEALGRGIGRILPDALIQYIPMADGGEGTVDSIIGATGGRKLAVTVRDPLMREISSSYGISGDGTTAVIEMAAASGLELLGRDERDPWITSTFGTGQLISHALDQGCKKILLGIGGSATNDGGMGMARALGVKFLDAGGNEAEEGGGAAGKVTKIVPGGLDPRIGQTGIRVACDVSNPLTGPDGASQVYGPQKGADPDMVCRLDSNLSRLATLVREQLGKEVDRVPGAGAAGGLGAGLLAFLDASLVRGFEMVAESVNLEDAIRNADLVITGEGKMDSQTQFGKTPFGVAQMAKKHRKPVIAVAGTVDEGADALYGAGFDVIMPIQEKPSDLASAIKQAPALLERAGERIARLIRLQI